MAKRLSISQKLKKAKSIEAKKATVEEWSRSWQEDHANLVRMLERAIQTNDYDLACSATRQLKAVGHKRFDALPRVLNHLIDGGDTDDQS
jgi:hypothetical protein